MECPKVPNTQDGCPIVGLLGYPFSWLPKVTFTMELGGCNIARKVWETWLLSGCKKGVLRDEIVILA